MEIEAVRVAQARVSAHNPRQRHWGIAELNTQATLGINATSGSRLPSVCNSASAPRVVRLGQLQTQLTRFDLFKNVQINCTFAEANERDDGCGKAFFERLRQTHNGSV